jgi:hypothetical protein
MPMSTPAGAGPHRHSDSGSGHPADRTRERRAAIRHRRLAAFAGLLGFAGPALAYLDPSTGSMILSAVIGLFATIGLALKTYWYRLKSFFRGQPSSPPPAARPDDAREEARSGSAERDRARTAD